MRGELDVADAASVAATVAVRERVVIVDLAGLEFMDSSGLAALVLGRKRPRKPGATCCSPRRRTMCRGFRLAPVWPASSPSIPASSRRLAARGAPGWWLCRCRSVGSARRAGRAPPCGRVRDAAGEVTAVTFGRRPEGRERDRPVSCAEVPVPRPDGLAFLREARNAAWAGPRRRGPVRWARE